VKASQLTLYDYFFFSHLNLWHKKRALLQTGLLSFFYDMRIGVPVLFGEIEKIEIRKQGRLFHGIAFSLPLYQN